MSSPLPPFDFSKEGTLGPRATGQRDLESPGLVSAGSGGDQGALEEHWDSRDRGERKGPRSWSGALRVVPHGLSTCHTVTSHLSSSELCPRLPWTSGDL